MYRNIVFMLAMVAMPVVHAQTIPGLKVKEPAKAFAIVVANEDYQKQHDGTIANTLHSIYYANLFYAALIHEHKLPKENVDYAQNVNAGQIRSLLDNLLAHAQLVDKNPHLIIYFSGKISIAPGGDVTILPVDAYANNMVGNIALQYIIDKVSSQKNVLFSLYLDAENINNPLTRISILEDGGNRISLDAPDFRGRIAAHIANVYFPPVNSIEGLGYLQPYEQTVADVVGPEIIILEPAANAAKKNSNQVVIKGSIRDQSVVNKVFVAGVEAHLADSMHFYAVPNLAQGFNALEVVGIDEFFNTSKTYVEVFAGETVFTSNSKIDKAIIIGDTTDGDLLRLYGLLQEKYGYKTGNITWLSSTGKEILQNVSAYGCWRTNQQAAGGI
ncbi:MAG: hypothetical protein HC896_01660 [Bacteroidales bacterium]|nr:hypothetical protein [Bacteroidales bacterium]